MTPTYKREDYEARVKAYARALDYDAWTMKDRSTGMLHPLLNTRRDLSRRQAERVIEIADTEMSAWQEPLPQPEPRVSGWWDRMAERMFPRARAAQ